MTTSTTRLQHAVDTWFSTHAPVWNDMYRDSSVVAQVYQRRQMLALGWVDRLSLESSARVLEIGCGAGYASVALAERGFRVTATDTVPRLLCLARERAVNYRVQFTLADAHALGFGDATFQLVIALGVIPWLHSPALAVREMARVLRPGGLLLVTADNRQRLTQLLDPRLTPALAGARRIARRVVRARPRDVDSPPRMHSPGELDVVLASSGLDKLAGLTSGFGPFTFLGRPIVTGLAAASVDRGLQRLADAGLPGFRYTGAQYLVLGRKATVSI